MRSTRAPWIGLGVAAAVLLLAFLLPWLAGWAVHARTPAAATDGELPPLHGFFAPEWWGVGTLPALLLALVGCGYGDRMAVRLSWRRLLLVAYGAGLAWLLALANIDGRPGIDGVLGSDDEYLQTARAVDDVPAMLDGFVDRIPIDAEGNWPVHVAGHPPGALLLFVGLVRAGLGDLAAGLVVSAIAATVPLAVLTTLRALHAEDAGRRAAPFLVLAPAAVFFAVSADALYAAIGGWGIAALALAVRAGLRQRRAELRSWSAAAGLLLGYGMLCSYGFVLLGAVAIGVLLAGRSWRPLAVVVPAALAVVAVFAWLGFAWWEAYPVLRERYWDGIAGDRPASYWLWANLAALLLSAGPVLGPALAQTAARARSAPRAIVLPVAGAVAAVAVADLSLMSKAEVERIWLLFVPWLLVSTALLPERWRRPGLLLQVVTALVVEHLLYTSW
jgi:hypothetical protein